MKQKTWFRKVQKFQYTRAYNLNVFSQQNFQSIIKLSFFYAYIRIYVLPSRLLLGVDDFFIIIWLLYILLCNHTQESTKFIAKRY